METINGLANLPMIDREALIRICQSYHIRELAVFGSILRDDFAATSDVDVLVDLAPSTPIRSLLDRARLVVELEGVFGRSVDLAEKRRLYPMLADEILSTRKVMYVAPE